MPTPKDVESRKLLAEYIVKKYGESGESAGGLVKFKWEKDGSPCNSFQKTVPKGQSPCVCKGRK